MRKSILFLLCCAVAGNVFGQARYPVSAIAPALLKNAHVVKRLEEQSFEVFSLEKAILKRREVITILDEEGQSAARLVEMYDRLRSIGAIEGSLYDAAGNLVKKVKAKDIGDFGATSDISLYEDNRVKVHDFRYNGYPYTVEYDVEVIYNNTFTFPGWVPQGDEDYSVEKSRFTFTAPAQYTVRYKSFNIQNAPVVATEKEKKSMTWEVGNLPAIKRPFASPPWHELTPTVILSPTTFQVEGYKGDASSWLEYGKFNLLLNQDRDKLPPDVLQQSQKVIAGIADPRDKVKKLYEFMQQRTRYISIQLGVGGWQPFDATYVAQKGYGDCKALSNFMYSLLKANGIRSHYTRIRAGRSTDDLYLMEDFPSNQSNHIVLCVPLAKDTLWLECTSQTDPAGYMGGFTGNRKALAITEEGGKLVATPRYGVEENLQVRKIRGVVDEEGNLTATVSSRYTAMQQDRRYELLHTLSKEKLKEVLNEELHFSTYEINDFSYKSKKDLIPEVDEELKLAVSGYATVSGRRLFITPNLMTRDGHKEIDVEGRTCDFVFGMAYRDVDSIEISIPAGYKVEAMPQAVSLKTSYGNYSFDVTVDGDKIVYNRRMERFAGRFPAKEAAQIAKFYNEIYKADRSRIVLVKKEG